MTSALTPVARRFARPGPVLISGVIVLAGAVLLSMCLGSRAMGLPDLWAVLTGSASAEYTSIVADFRAPRTIAAVVGGAALAVAGAVIQGHTRNRLADPGLLGLTGGSALAVVIAISFLGFQSPTGYVWFAVGGAAVGVILVASVAAAAGRRRQSSPAVLVLAGAAVSALLGAMTGVFLLMDAAALERYRFWTVGSLAAVRGWDTILVALPLAVAGIVIALAHTRSLDALAFGDDVAAALGHSLRRARATGLISVSLLVAGAVACCGSLSFIGLVAPNALRLIIGPAHAALLPATALYGAALTVVADIAGRFLVHPAELPVGVVLSILGGPLFILLIVRTLARKKPA